mgnify:CR=1 FL=1
MATQEAYVQVKDLKKHYGDGDARLTVLDGIDTSINRGEICVMLGPSGSGKSTFLNLIGGLEDVNHEYGCTIIIVTHNAAIARMANRVLRLRDGRIVEDELNESPVAAAELDW